MQLKQQIEPCMRITFQIPKDAAQRLRQLAIEGNAALQSIGIRSIQLENESEISLNPNQQQYENEKPLGSLAGFDFQTVNVPIAVGSSIGGEIPQVFNANNTTNASPNTYMQFRQQQDLQQKLLLQQQNAQNSSLSMEASSTNNPFLKQLQPVVFNAPNVEQHQLAFKSPNTVCPMDGKIPVTNVHLTNSNVTTTPDFPFESMRQARVLQGRDNALNVGTIATSVDLCLGTSAKHSATGGGQQRLIDNLEPPPNITLKVVKNAHSGELITTTVTNSSKPQFLQPPPPPYPGVGISGSAQCAAVVDVPANAQNYIYSKSTDTPSLPTASTTYNNNIAISSPLLVNLLQNDYPSSFTIHGQQVKNVVIPQLHSQQEQQRNQLNQQQAATMIDAMSPQHVIASPRYSTTSQTQPSRIQHPVVNAVVGAIDNNLNVPLTSKNNIRHTLEHQQSMLSPNGNNNLYPPTPHYRYNSHQTVSSQQNTQMRQHIQRHHPQIQINQQRFIHSQQAGGGNDVMIPAQQQVIVGAVPTAKQQPQQARLKHSQQKRINLPTNHQQQQQQQQLLVGSENASSANHPLSSTHMTSHLLHQKLISSSPVEQTVHSPLNQLTQVLPPAIPSPTIRCNANIPVSHVLATSSSNAPPPPPPEYNQAAVANNKWPGALTKPMDSITKSSFQEFTRYQMQYNLQQKQQQIISEIANSLPGAAAANSQGNSVEVFIKCNPVADLADVQTSTSSKSSKTGLIDSGEAVHVLSDPLISLSDLDALTTNDLDSLLPTINCDIDSTLSLDDKNELESLLQDAKDLDLDLIEENLSAVGMDIDETTSTLLEANDIPYNVIVDVHQQSRQTQEKQQQQPTYETSIHQNASIANENQLQNKQFLQHATNSAIKLQQQQQAVPSPVQRNNLIQKLIANNNNNNGNNHFLPASNVMNSIQSHTTTITTLVNSPLNAAKQFLINPLTGELEPSPSDDSDTEMECETEQFNSMPLRKNHHPVFKCTSSEASVYQACVTTNSSDVATYPMKFKPSAIEQSNFRATTSSKTKRSKKYGKLDVAQSKLKDELHPTTANETNFLTTTTTTTASTSAGSTMKKKVNLLREKLQQGMRERKTKDVTTPNAIKPKRDKNKIINKSRKNTLATQAESAKANSPKTSLITTSRSFTNCDQQQQQQQPLPSSDEVASSSSSSTAAEKIKLRLKFNPKTELTNSTRCNANVSNGEALNQTQLRNQILSSKLKQPPDPPTQYEQMHFKKDSNQYDCLLTQNQTELELAANGCKTENNNTNNAANEQLTSSAVDEPRVPPLHISLRGGKNSIVIKNSRKERKKLQNANNSVECNASNSSKAKDYPVRGGNHLVTDSLSAIDELKKFKQNRFFTSVSTQSIPTRSTTTTSSTSTTHQRINVSSEVGESVSIPCTSPTSNFLTNKNGLTISALNALDNIKNRSVLDNILASNNLSKMPQALAKHLLQSSPQQLAKFATLPNSITLSTINSQPTRSTNSSVLTTKTTNLNATRLFNNLQMKQHTLKTKATITPIAAGTELAKSHKPPSYVTAVQQLQMQKQQQQQQQQQQLANIIEKQTQQQMLAVAVTMLPSATTLKRIEITQKDSKDMCPKASVACDAGQTKNQDSMLITSSIALTNPSTTNVLSLDNSVSLNRNASVPTSCMDSAATCNDNTNPVLLTCINNMASSMTSSTTTTTTNAVVTTLRNSPANAAPMGGSMTIPSHTNTTNGSGGGEDSGIESMDALSEKSPHQGISCSPQALPPDRSVPMAERKPNVALSNNFEMKTAPKIDNENNSQLQLHKQIVQMDVIANDEIEQALAKLDGIIEDDIFINDELKIDNTLEAGRGKANGDCDLLLPKHLQTSETYQYSHSHEDLIKALTTANDSKKINEENTHTISNQNVQEKNAYAVRGSSDEEQALLSSKVIDTSAEAIEDASNNNNNKSNVKGSSGNGGNEEDDFFEVIMEDIKDQPANDYDAKHALRRNVPSNVNGTAFQADCIKPTDKLDTKENPTFELTSTNVLPIRTFASNNDYSPYKRKRNNSDSSNSDSQEVKQHRNNIFNQRQTTPTDAGSNNFTMKSNADFSDSDEPLIEVVGKVKNCKVPTSGSKNTNTSMKDSTITSHYINSKLLMENTSDSFANKHLKEQQPNLNALSQPQM